MNPAYHRENVSGQWHENYQVNFSGIGDEKG